jgi:starch synthase
MRADLLAAYPAVNPAKVVTIRNGVDTQKFAPNHDAAVVESFGISGPYAIFVGRITRQKGLAHLLRAWKDVPAEYGLVLAAGSPDEEGIGNEVAELIADLQRTRSNVWWIKEMLPHDQLTAMLTAGEAAPFEKALTESITRLMAQPDVLKKYGAAGRVRAQKLFGWDAVAALTVDLYRRVIA